MTDQELAALQSMVQEEFPDLVLRRTDGRVVAEGRYTLFADDRAVDEYQIRVQMPEEDNGYPILFETAGRIPRIHDRHIEDQAGKCCVMAYDELVFRYPDGCEVVEFLREPVRGFLISQSYFEQEKDWPFGSRSHGLEGRLEFYAEQVGSHDVVVGLRVLAIVAASSAGGKVDCPCGSKRRLRKCHRDAIRRLRERIPKRVAKDLMRQIESQRPQQARSRPRRRSRWWPST